MKRKLLTAAAICAVFILCSCEEPRATNVVPAYPFETLHGSWIRNGNIGGMGVTKLKSYSKNGAHGPEEWMEWTVQGQTILLKCEERKNPRPGLHTFAWYAVDESTGQPQPDVFMRITVAIESENDLYMETDAAGMGGLTMARVN